MLDYRSLWEEADERAGIATEWLSITIEIAELMAVAIEQLYARIVLYLPDFPDPTELVALTRKDLARARVETGLDKVAS